MSSSGTTYLVDTDVLAHIWHRTDSAAIYSGLVDFAKAGRVKTIRQVFKELEKHRGAHRVLKPHIRELVVHGSVQFCREVRAKLETVKNNADFLWPQVGGKNPDPADPWLLAVALAHGFTLVTDEKKESSRRLPAACGLPETKCHYRSGPHFLIEVGLVTEIKPEQLSTHYFYGLGG